MKTGPPGFALIHPEIKPDLAISHKSAGGPVITKAGTQVISMSYVSPQALITVGNSVSNSRLNTRSVHFQLEVPVSSDHRR